MAGEGVTFEFKDLFEKLETALTKGFERIDHRVDRGFDEINRRLDGKADVARVAALEAKFAENEVRWEERFGKFVDSVDHRFKPLEQTQTEGVTLGKLGMWVIGTVGVGVFLGCVTILTAVLSGGHP